MLERLTDQEMADIALIVESSLKLGAKVVEYAIQKRKETAKAAKQFQEATPQIFRGNIYDLSYFWGYDNLPFSTIEEIPFNQRMAVKQSFDSLMQQGYVMPRNNSIVLTEKGKALIDDPKYIRAAIQDRNSGLQDIGKVLQQEYKRRIAERGTIQEMTKIEAGKEAMQKGISSGAEQTVKSGVVIQAGAETAAKTSAKAGTGAAAGAVTMGAATAAQIGYELAQGSIRIIQEKTLK